MWKLTLSATLLSIFMLTGTAYADELSLNKDAKIRVSEQLIDQHSVKFKNVRAFKVSWGYAVNGCLNSKNRMGVYMGVLPFECDYTAREERANGGCHIASSVGNAYKKDVEYCKIDK